MPVLHCVVHQILKRPDGSPTTLRLGQHELSPEATEQLIADLNDHYNRRPNKVWGTLDPTAENAVAGALQRYQQQSLDFMELTRAACEHLKSHMEGANLASGGHLLFAHYRQGMSEFMLVAMLHHSDGVSITEELGLAPSSYLDLAQLHQAARINLSEWQNNPQSRQYASFTKGRSSKKVADYFRDFLGFADGVDAPEETRTLLQAFDDYVAAEALPEAASREKAECLVEYAQTQTRQGQPIALEELSELLDEDHPEAFYQHIRNSDYGLSAEIPADKRTLSQFQRYAGRAEGMSISFDAHLLGSRIEYDETNDRLIIRQPPTRLKDQLQRHKKR